jgi:hypothetical protein
MKHNKLIVGIMVILALCFGLVMSLVTAQTEGTAEATPPVVDVVTMVSDPVMPPDMGPVGLVRIGSIDGNMLLVGGFSVIVMALLVLMAVVWQAITGTRDNVSPEAINQILASSFEGMLQLWDKLETEVNETPTPLDDVAFSLANIPVDVLTAKLKEMGLEVRPAGGDVTFGIPGVQHVSVDAQIADVP